MVFRTWGAIPAATRTGQSPGCWHWVGWAGGALPSVAQLNYRQRGGVSCTGTALRCVKSTYTLHRHYKGINLFILRLWVLNGSARISSSEIYCFWRTEESSMLNRHTLTHTHTHMQLQLGYGLWMNWMSPTTATSNNSSAFTSKGRWWNTSDRQCLSYLSIKSI